MSSRDLYATVTGCSGIISIQVEAGYSMISANATVECEATSLTLGSAISIDMGYADAHQAVFVGFVKKINKTTPNGIIQITAMDVLVRAVDYFLAADDPEQPLTFYSIDDRSLVNALLGEVGLSLASGAVSPTFTFGTNEDGAKFNLQSLAEIIQWCCSITGRLCYADAGSIYYVDRKPYIVGGDTAVATWTTGASGQIISIGKEIDNSKIRNVIKVYGKNPLTARASASSPYIAVDQASVIAHELLDTQEICDATAAVNLDILNRLSTTYTVDLYGDASIVPRSVYHITESFTGADEDVFIYRVSHNFDESGFLTNVTATA
jgi:hypothetical protein